MAAVSSKYPGFLSYSHRDRKFADWLHRAIERYRVPPRLVGTEGTLGKLPARLYPIFRDRDELAAGPLAHQLFEAISQSRCFILICSPESARSRWVNEEVTHFLSAGDPSRLLCLIVDGSPNADDPARECLPPVLRERGIEPMAAELSDDADGRDNARLKIIAGLLGVGFDDLKRRDLVARNRRLVALAATSLSIAAITAVLAWQAVKARNDAEHSRQQGEELIGFMLGELRGKLEPLGKLEILDAVGDKAMAYFEGLDGGRDSSAAAIAARATALRQIGEVRFAQGRPVDAINALDAALKLQRDLSRVMPDDDALLFELGQTEFWVGYAAVRAGQVDRAETSFMAYAQIAERLVARDPEKVKWQLEVIYAATNLGVLFYERHRYAEALPLFEQAVSGARALLQRTPELPDADGSMLGAMAWSGSTLIALGRHDEGLTRLQEHAALLRMRVAAQPDDRRLQVKLARALITVGYESIEVGRGDLALASAGEGAAQVASLRSNDASNIDYRQDAARLAQIEAAGLMLAQRWAEAAASNDEAIAILHPLAAADPEDTAVSTALIASWNMRWQMAWRDDDRTALRRVAKDALQVYGRAKLTSIDGRIAQANAHLFALELARWFDQDDAARQRHRTAAEAALESIAPDDAQLHRRITSFRELLALERGTDHIPDTAGAINAVPWAYSVRGYVERHCRGGNVRLPARLCDALGTVGSTS